MALIKCEDCGREISSKAVACPGCGRPQSPPKIVFHDDPRATSTSRPLRRPFFGTRFITRALTLAILLGIGIAVVRFDVGGIGNYLSQRTVFSSKIDTAESYLLERIEHPSTYERLEWGPMEKRYDYSQLSDIFVTWVAYEHQDDFGNIKRQKAFFKIDAATGRILSMKIH